MRKNVVFVIIETVGLIAGMIIEIGHERSVIVLIVDTT